MESIEKTTQNQGSQTGGLSRRVLQKVGKIELWVRYALGVIFLGVFLYANISLNQKTAHDLAQAVPVPTPDEPLYQETLLWSFLLLLALDVLALYLLYKEQSVYRSEKMHPDGRFLARAIVLCLCGCSPIGVLCIIYYIQQKRLLAFQTAQDGQNEAAKMFREERPSYVAGYDEANHRMIRLVAPKKHRAAPYQVRGIEDVVAKNNWKGWLYLAPVIVLVAVFLIYPLINTVFIAFAKNYQYASGAFDGLTLRNFTYILGLTTKANGAHETYFISYAIPNTFVLTFVTVAVSTLLALFISVALNSIPKFQKFLQTVFFLPYVTNAIAVGMVFSVLFDDNGVINYIFHSTTRWVYGADQWVAMVPLCLYIVWGSIPFKILILLSGLQGVDKQYYQAAQIDSASRHKVLWKITVPLLSPQILYIMITSVIGAFKEYTHIVGLFNGPGTLGQAGTPNMETIVYYIYQNLSTNTSEAAAAAVFLFVIILIFTAIQFVVSKKRVHY